MNEKSHIQSKINEASNILVTVSQNPTVDELTAALGLTLAIDKMRKHSSAIFSGEIPNFMKFLHPEKTFEDSTASFRDFIISLDKEKADKLRYKVEGDLVKIFITPYHTKLSPDDLMFGEGELNVDLVIALGVKQKEDLDKAIVGHGRILHDATIITINLEGSSNLGAINWSGIDASGYSEIVADLIHNINTELFTKQISTALLTGIVLATEQFSNSRTKPATMAAASRLLAAGADQQLIVAEIKGQGSVSQTAPDMIHDIPNNGIASQIGDTSIEPEVSPDDLDSIRSSLDPYMPPSLPDFSSNQLSPPEQLSEAPTYDSTPPAIFPEDKAAEIATFEPPTEPESTNIPPTFPEPTADQTIDEPKTVDPKQFVIPTLNQHSNP